MRRFFRALLVLLLCVALSAVALPQDAAISSWGGVLRDASGQPVPNATIWLVEQGHKHAAATSETGIFTFRNLPSGNYSLSVESAGKVTNASRPVLLAANHVTVVVTMSSQGDLTVAEQKEQSESTGGEQLSSRAVSDLPLNKRDFSTLLLLAAGTMTDTNGATNFTQQFAINGQRGVEATFAMDGADTSDPEMGGGTFTNFNVDAVEGIQSNSGWMPAEIGRGAAGFTNILTRTGKSGFHGSVFEFLRNSALDARNYFDHPTEGRIPPFRRNEFGFTNGGPVVIPHLYDGSGKTFYFGQYQGFRQVLGTTQVLAVPTPQERSGLDTSAFPGDTLYVPVDSQMAGILARYPLPNYPQGSYGAHTYATSSKVTTNANQFSLRIDQTLDEKSQIFARFTWDNLTGPTTNPDQTAIDPSFAVEYKDHQRNGVLTYSRTVSPQYSFESSISFTRTTPGFPTPNHTDPAVRFNDGLFEAFNSAAGSVMQAYGNLFQARQNFAYITGRHAWKFGGEIRLNRDTTYFGTSPNGEYDFGGGTAYSPVDIRSQSGTHDIHVGDPLPDTLSGLLTGTPFAYNVAVAPPYFSSGDHIGPAAINRNNFAIYIQDTWKVSPRFVLDYGLRYDVYSPITERAKRTSGFLPITTPGVQQFVVNPQPGYQTNYSEWQPRVQLDWRATEKLHVRAGGSLMTIQPNIWQDNFLTGATPFVVYPHLTAAPGAQFHYGFQITPDQLPRAYSTSGQDIFASGNTKDVPANTVLDVDRYEHDLAAVTPSHQITPLNLAGIDRSFGNGLLETWTLGLERQFGNITADAAYVGTAGVKLPRIIFPNGFPGASPEYAPYTQFDSAGNVIGGFGYENVIDDTSHSTYNALQTSLSGTFAHGGPGVQASYTWSKSLDDVSGVIGGGTGSTGAQVVFAPQDPFNTHPEKGPSTFDVAHSFTLSVAQDLHLESLDFLQAMTKKLTRGWELLSISSISSGSPFTIYSGIQQTGAGSNGSDRPDQTGKPDLSTARKVREDYFGKGEANASYFYIPINLSGGTGPNSGRFGTLGRNTFRGPAYYNYDFAMIKDTPFGTRKSGSELVDLQFRAEFFNLFNIVNMGLPSNTIKGSGFGVISKTANNSRQIQFSLKLIY
ncbi:TonB-dependent receptor [Alloacidobacterium sp.]|uniref:TonB-dependent receptor n=1 Tax=Alloacidobacterium sp. TaxID=2951999 RepID=UPI002D674D72|nr:TonB-dependent receptor [Alloacidobacterium sp.]HYK35251.1 TonB-dependent receptor [Alloacidobacterium sp.]